MKHIKLFEQFTTEKQLEFDFDRNREEMDNTNPEETSRELGTMGFPSMKTFTFESPVFVRVDIESYAEKAMQWGEPAHFMEAMREIDYDGDFEWSYREFENDEISEDDFFEQASDTIQQISRQSNDQPILYTSVEPEDIEDSMIDDFNESNLAQYCEIPGVESIKAVKVTREGMFRVEVAAQSDMPIEEMKEWLSGQYSDGWGEGFEQHPINLNNLDVYVSTWSSNRFEITLVNP